MNVGRPRPRAAQRVAQPSVADPLWYKDAIIYEAHVRAFHDSDGDGYGDFRGLAQNFLAHTVIDCGRSYEQKPAGHEQIA